MRGSGNDLLSQIYLVWISDGLEYSDETRKPAHLKPYEDYSTESWGLLHKWIRK